MAGGTSKLGELLVSMGAIDRGQLGDALRQQAERGGRLGSNLIALGFIDDKTLAGALAKQQQVPSVTRAQIERVTEDVAHLVPPQMAERLRAIPVREDNGRLWVAMCNPADTRAIDELARVTKRPVRPMVAPEMVIDYALEKLYQVTRRGRAFDLLSLGGQIRAAAPAPVPLEAEVEAEYRAVVIEATTGYLDEAAPPKVQTLSRIKYPDLLSQLVAAVTDEEVLDRVLRFLAPDVPRLCAVSLQRGELGVWRSFGLDGTGLSEVRVNLGDVPQIARVLLGSEAYVGRLLPSDLGGFARPFGLAGEGLGIILPVRIAEQPVGVLLGSDASLSAMRQKAGFDRLVIKIDQALHMLHLRRELLVP